VDDEPLIRELFVDALADMEDVEVSCERSGFRAMTRVNQEPFDLLFTDIMMPGLNGLQTIEEVRQLQEGIHIIVISGYASDSILKEALEKGAKAYMKKPFGVTEIREAVERARKELAAKQE
jgi:YesN/AraC family two-component response regulator